MKLYLVLVALSTCAIAGDWLTDGHDPQHVVGFQETKAPVDSSPMSYAVDGTQFVALSAGSVLYGFALPPAP